MIVFQLTMPHCGSWNGKWTGADRLYIRTKRECDVPKEYWGKDFYYDWEDGWSACVSLTRMNVNEEREETEYVEMTVADYLDSGTEEGCPQTVSGWVSVKDRLPGQNGDYLAYTCDGIVWPYFFMAGVWEDALGYSTDTVTHWMPLPEPPEVEDEV